MDTIDRIIWEANMLVSVSNYLKWKDIISNILLKDNLYKVVDTQSKLVIAEVVAWIMNNLVSPRSFDWSQCIIVTTPHNSKKKETTSSYLLMDVIILWKYKHKHRKVLKILLLLVSKIIKPIIKDLNDALDIWLKL